MTEQEMLELAAKAAGVKGCYMTRPTGASGINQGPMARLWNPRTDDGDAFRLAVKLRIDLLFDSQLFDGTPIEVSCSWPPFGDEDCLSQLKLDDPNAATRLAITLAAAEIGKAMEGEKK